MIHYFLIIVNEGLQYITYMLCLQQPQKVGTIIVQCYKGFFFFFPSLKKIIMKMSRYTITRYIMHTMLLPIY